MNFKNCFLTLVSFLLINFCFAGDFYWVNNTGNWNDASHWSNTSGGIGGVGTPSKHDNIIIDQNSFTASNSTITISSNIAVNNLIISENVVPFTIQSNNTINFDIYGDLNVRAIFTNNIKASIHFRNNQNTTNELYFGWYKWKANIYFEGSGTYILKSPLQAHENTISLIQGTLNLNGNDVLCDKFISNSNKKRKLISGASSILAYNQWVTNKSKFNYNFSQTTIYVISEDVNAVNKGGDNYSIKQSQSSSTNKTVSNASVTNDTVSCGNACDGSIMVNFETDCPNGSVNWLPNILPIDTLYTGECPTCPIPGPNGSDTLFNLCPGFYTAVISNDCDGSVQAPQGEVKGHPSIVEIVHTENITSCQDSCDGSTFIVVTGAPYAIFSYEWLTGNPADTNTSLSNLCDGLYEVEVQDGFGCIDTFQFNIPEPLAIDPNVNVVDVLCFGDCTGSATSNPTGGNGGYTYQWHTSGDTTASITNLCAGFTDSLTVTDVNGCVGGTSITITSPTQIQVDTTVQNVSCGGLCDGTITVDVTGGGVGPFTHNWSTGFVETANSSSIGGLCFGTYTDSIVDGNGCDTVITIVVTEPAPLITSTNFSDVTCFGACNGTATTNTSGGNFPYTYVWSSVPVGQVTTGQGTDSIADLCPGQYIVDITDSRFCTVSDTITITEPNPLLVNPSSTDISCPGFCNGTATAAPTGGTTPYSYSWNPGGQTTPGVNSLCPGTYYVTVTDSNNCMSTDSVTIVEPVPMVLTMSSTDMSCNGVCDGTAAVNVAGGVTPYTYIWASIPIGQVSSGQGTDSIFNLCDGTYTVTVTDSNGCTLNNNTVVNEPNPITINLSTSDLSCNAICNGTASVAPIGGNGPYTVSWNGGPFTATTSINGLCAGAHTVDVRDDNGCIESLNFNIAEPPVLTTITTGTDILCNGVCSGTALTTPAGGTAPYTYSWSNTDTTANISGLCAGTYIVTITDDSLCTLVDSIVINEPVPLDANAQFTNMSCNGICNGTAISLPIGGTAPYSYSWNPGGNSQSLSNLCAGQYIITVTDSNNCTDADTVNIVDPTPLTVNAVSINASCGTICDGEAMANPAGGTTPYSYVWSNGDTTQNATNLCAGTYGVTVTDSAGCSVVDSVTINNLIVINIITDTVGISCNGLCDGQATANPSGGTTPYTYLWTPTGQNTQTATGLCPGTYTVTVTDSNGCVSSQSVDMPTDPSVLVPNGSLTNVTCNGACDGTVSSSPTGGTPPYTIVWSVPDTNNLCPGTYTVTVTDNNNCSQTDTLIVTEPDSITANPVIAHVDCNGNCNGSITLNASGGTGSLSYLWAHDGSTNADVSSLCAGNYSVTVTDSTGCSRVFNFTINEPTVLTATPLSTDVSCFGLCDGTASVLVGGGTTPYTYFWSPGGEVTDSIFNLCAGNYQVTVRDSNNCVVNQNVTINEPNQLLANLTGTTIACNGNCDGSVIATPSGGTSPYSYAWTGLPDTTSSILNLCAGTYTVDITDDNGCSITDSYDVTAPPMLNVTLDSTNITCNGNNNGTGTVTPNGGTPPYTYSWVPSGQTTPTATGLTPGIHTVTVTDSLGCFFTGSIDIQEPAIIDDNEIVTNANCGFNDGVITMNPSGGTPPYSHSWSNGDTTSTISGLGVGFYTDTITDFNGCTEIFTIAISNPSGPTGVTATVNDASCYGACDGNANVIPIGGTPGYSYTWTPGGQTDSTITGQCAGTYNLTISDALNCVLNTFVVIGEADSITDNLVTTDATCNGLCDGTANVSPSGGTAPYTYLWSNGSTSASTSGLCAGPASVTITDFNGCTKVVNFNISSPNLLTVATSFTDALCNGSCDGTATATPADGTSPYTYQWNDPLSQTTPTATGLCAGSYDVIVSDNNGCTTNATVNIAEPNLIAANEVITDATCGANDGGATVAPTGGTAPYTYVWSNGPTTPTVSGLSAGTYTVDITDSNSCTQSFPIAISNTNGPVINTSQNNASCNGVCDGDASVSIVSGTPNYSYLWTPGNQTTTSITGLCAGNYTVEVTDGLGCITTEVVAITDNSLITSTITTIDATCNGTCDGSAMVVPSGGIPPYNYNWSTGHTTNAVGGLCAGNYTVTITDAIGCSITENVSISDANLLTLSTTSIDANCNGGCDGEATVTPSGGTAPFTYLWSNGATTPNIVGLCAGTYDVDVTDISGCTASISVNIGEGTLITAGLSVNDATCGVCDGDATITPAGGSGAPYSILWLPGGQTSTTVNNLCPGAYTVEVSDNVGCMQSFNILINNPNGPSISADSDSVSCFGSCDGNAWVTINSGTSPYIYQWDDPLLQTTDTANSLCGGLYNIVVQDSLGCISVDSTTLYEPQEIMANITSTAPSCTGVCDGTATVNPTGGIGNIAIQWGASAGNQTTPTATGLCAGTHLVTLTDDNGCSITDSVTISSPTAIGITISATSVTCNGDCDGTALATASGGAAPYSYSWDDILNQQNSLAAGLCPQLYTVTVTDNNNCIATDTVTVPNPTILSTSSVVTPINCAGNCDGSITTTPTGGVGPYTYLWSNGQTTQTATNLCPGTYNVVVVDNNNCTTTDTLTLTDPATLNDSTIINGPTCGLCDGDATANPTGGVGPYTYLWGDGQTTQTAVGLCAGIITLEITDQGTGCVYNFNVLVNSSTGPTLVTTGTGETCTGSCDGTATINASGGLAPYTYLWNPTGQVDSTATGLCTGFYDVTVQDAQGCISVDTITISTNGLSLSVTNVVPESCYSNCDGEATVTVGAGSSPFTYLWNPSGQNTPTATNLCTGIYVATVTDDLNCSDSISTTITGPDSISVTIIETTPIGCNSSCDGELTASVTGGTGPYNYLWSDGQTTPTATGLCAGTYTVTITDDNGCTKMATFDLTEPTPIVANENLMLPSCNQCNGSITVAPTGGIGPYTFNWSPGGEVTSTITNQCAGAYTVDITDVTTGCSISVPIALSNSNAPDPNVSSTPISCNGVCDGELTSTPIGGTSPYTYLWNPTGQTSATATNLCTGIYSVEVTDSVGCIGVSVDTLSEPTLLMANVNSNNILCNGTCDGWAVVNPSGGTTPYNTAVWTPGNISVDSLTNLCAGTYYVTLTDDNGCSVSDSAIITEPTLITIAYTSTDATCSSNCDGGAVVSPSGGIGPYNYSWTPGGQNTSSPNDLCLGLNTVTVTDQNNCSVNEVISIASTDTINALTENDTTICFGDPFNLNGIATGNVSQVEWFELPGMVSLGTTDTITITASVIGTTCYVFEAVGACNDFDTICVTVEALPIVVAGPDVTIVEESSTVLTATGGITYSWTPSAGLNDSTLSSPTASPMQTTTYYVTGTSTGGCSATDSVIVTVIPTIEFPDGITPNGDGKNDTWVIDYIQEYPNAVVEIYNRWGELLFHSDNYQNDWDGTYNGENLPIGTYYYIIDLHDDKTEPFTGPLTVLR